jgi:protein-tyrosine phosphatase
VIDLHCHLLPGLDDGPSDIRGSLAMARAALAAGTETMVATPHVSATYGNEPEQIDAAIEALSAALRDRSIPLRVVAGAEVAFSRLGELDEQTLKRLCLGPGPYLLVESPYSESVRGLEPALFELQLAGLRPVLAHPERCPAFQKDPGRLARLVERGVLCSVTSASRAGRFGRTVRRFVLRLLRDELVHDVASDAHDHLKRPPGLMVGFDSTRGEVPGMAAEATWLTEEVPAAILAGHAIPPRPERQRGRSFGPVRLAARRR